MTDKTDIPLEAWSLADFVRGVAAPAPAPGSGAAGAVALALAAACLGKACTLSYRHSQHPDLAEMASSAASIANVALEGAQRDADDFRAWLLAHGHLPSTRLREDAGLLLDVAEHLAAVANRAEPLVTTDLAADLAAARALLAAFHAIARRNLADLGS